MTGGNLTEGNGMNEISEVERSELIAYADGYMAGIQEVLDCLRIAYQEAKSGYRLAALERVMMDYGVDLDESKPS